MGELLILEEAGELQRYYLHSSIEKKLINLSDSYPDAVINWCVEDNQIIVFVETENMTNTELHEQLRKLQSCRQSQFVGSIGDRINFEVASVEYIGRFDKADLGFYRYYRFRDNEGNIFTWKMWNKPPLPENIHSITGTITDQYANGTQKINKLKRCKVA